MRASVFLAMLASLVVASALRAAEPTSPFPEKLKLAVGYHCEVTTFPKTSGWDKTTTTYTGTVMATDGNGITMRNVTQASRVEQCPPLLNRVPYINRVFKNVGIGRAHLGEKQVSVTYAEMASFREVPDKEFKSLTESAKDNFFAREPADTK